MFKFVNEITVIRHSGGSLAYRSSSAEACSRERHGFHNLQQDSENSEIFNYHLETFKSEHI